MAVHTLFHAWNARIGPVAATACARTGYHV